MFVATVVVSLLLAAALAGSAIRKLSHQPPVVQTYLRVGVPEDKLNYLAAILLAGAAGLALGLLWAPLGVAAAIGVTCYFIAAIGFHVRSGDTAHLPMPAALLVTAAVALALRVVTV
jgi:hypothetical protein